MSTIRAFSVWVKGLEEHATCINARSAGAARYEKWLDTRDFIDVKIIDMRSRSMGPPHSSEAFIRNAVYRGLPAVRCGDRVMVGESAGTIIGHNSSANFDVLFDEDSKYGGQTLNVHPSECKFLAPDAQRLTPHLSQQ